MVDAFKLVPIGKLAGLRTVRLGGEVPVNPMTQDVFRAVIALTSLKRTADNPIGRWPVSNLRYGMQLTPHQRTAT